MHDVSDQVVLVLAEYRRRNSRRNWEDGSGRVSDFLIQVVLVLVEYRRRNSRRNWEDGSGRVSDLKLNDTEDDECGGGGGGGGGGDGDGDGGGAWRRTLENRHFCKNCRRYWTKGGSLRNIPVGGGTRKNTTHSSSKKSSSTKRLNRSSSSSAAAPAPPALPSLVMDHDHQMLDMSGNLSFSSLLASTGQFGSLLESMNAGDSRLHLNHFGEYPLNPNANSNTDSSRIGDAALEMGDSSCWGSSNGWPDLAIYTPGSSFQ